MSPGRTGLIRGFLPGLVAALAVLSSPAPAAAPLGFPEDHHGCLQAFTGTVIGLHLQRLDREPAQEDLFVTEVRIVVDRILAGLDADTLTVVTGNTLRFHSDGFLDGYQDYEGGLVWFRRGDRVLVAAPLRASDGSIDLTRPFVPRFARFLDRSLDQTGQRARVVIGYSVKPLLDAESPRHLSEGAEALLDAVEVEYATTGETLQELIDAIEAFEDQRCGERLFGSEVTDSPSLFWGPSPVCSNAPTASTSWRPGS